MEKASFTNLESATASDWSIIDDPRNGAREREQLVRNLVKLLEMQRNDDTFGWPINGYEHCLQTATRALRDGADDETILCALFHDATEAIDHGNHAETAAALVAPYVSAENVWLVRHHALFQNYHCATHPERFSNDREAFRDHPAFERTVRFCALWDQTSFDPGYDSLPMEKFIPIIRRLIVGRDAG